MSIIKKQSELHKNMVTWRHHIHKHPELSFKEELTSDYIASVLEANDIEMHRGLAVTGIVATIHGKKEGRVIGLRADMDALPIQEKNDFSHKSVHDGKMHACGHDGHSTMLLGAAVHLKENNNFSGTVHFIFQPAEEGGGGGRVMVEEGIFEKFPCEAVYGMHNWPGMAEGQFAVHDTAVMAANETLKISIKGKGGHAAMPQLAIDPIVIASQIVIAVQTIISRSINPVDKALISITKIHGGTAYNVIDDEVKLSGTIRTFKPETRSFIEKKMKEVAEGIAKAQGAGVNIEFDLVNKYPATINSKKESEFAASVAKKVVGEENVITDVDPCMGGEDFSYLLNEKPGSYLYIGQGDNNHSAHLHTTKYDFNDNLLPLGVNFWVDLVKNYFEK